MAQRGVTQGRVHHMKLKLTLIVAAIVASLITLGPVAVEASRAMIDPTG